MRLREMIEDAGLDSIKIRDKEVHVGDVVRRISRNSYDEWCQREYLRVEKIEPKGIVYFSRCFYDMDKSYEADVTYRFSNGTYGTPIYFPAVNIYYTIENPQFKGNIKYRVNMYGDLYDVTNSSRGRDIHAYIRLEDIPDEKIYFGQLAGWEEVRRLYKDEPWLEDEVNKAIEKNKEELSKKDSVSEAKEVLKKNGYRLLEDTAIDERLDRGINWAGRAGRRGSFSDPFANLGSYKRRVDNILQNVYGITGVKFTLATIDYDYEEPFEEGIDPETVARSIAENV